MDVFARIKLRRVMTCYLRLYCHCQLEERGLIGQQVEGIQKDLNDALIRVRVRQIKSRKLFNDTIS